MPTPNWCFYQRSITLLLCTNEAHHLPAAAHPHGFAAQQQNRGLGGGQNGAFAWLPPPGRSAVLSRSAGVSGVSPLPAAAVQMVSFAPHAAMQSLRCCRAEFALRPWGWEQPGGNRLVLPQKARGGMRGQRPPVHSAGGAVPGFTGALRAVHSRIADSPEGHPPSRLLRFLRSFGHAQGLYSADQKR